MLPRKKIGEAIGEMLRTAVEQPSTVQYPFGPPIIAERFRGKLDIDPVKCTGCGVCEIVCPAEVISMIPTGKREIGGREIVIKRPVFDLYTCISCGQCVEDCKFNALKLTKQFELAVFKKDSLIMRKGLNVVQ